MEEKHEVSNEVPGFLKISESPGFITQEVKKERHCVLDDAICNIQSVIEEANSLLMRISNEDVVENESQARCEPSLEAVLMEGPDRINKSCDEIKVILKKIAAKLF